MATKNDTQVGYPGRIYSGTKAAVEALGGLTGGEVAYATDTNQFGFYNGSAWQWGASFATADHGHAGVYAPAAQGVTDGDSHDHTGGAGATIGVGGVGSSGQPAGEVLTADGVGGTSFERLMTLLDANGYGITVASGGVTSLTRNGAGYLLTLGDQTLTEGATTFNTGFYAADASNPAFTMVRTTATVAMLQGGVTGDSYRRILVDVSGKMNWGSGAATRDTALERSGTARLKVTNDLHALGTLYAGGDSGGIASTTALTNATVAASSGTGAVKMGGATNRDSVGWLKGYVGTTAVYVPYWTTVTG